MPENRDLMEIFRFRREEVRGENLHIEELHEFVLTAYHSNEKANGVKCVRDVTRMGGGEMNTEF